MSDPAPSPEPARRLHAVLDRLLRRMTRRMYGSPREMQVDASTAITLLREVEIPNREYVASTLAGVIRELGQRRPDLLRHVVLLESVVARLEERLREDPAGEG